jgi:hypothetical protein
MISLLQDPFEGVVLGHTLIDWSNPDLDADEIGRILVGDVDHWDAPEYDGMEPWEIERKILFDAKRPNWGGTSKWGKEYFKHMLILGKLMMTDVNITPSLYDCLNFFCLSVGGANKKLLNFIGSQNSGKSFGICFIIFICMYIDPERSSAFVANPFDNASDAQIWGTIEELWDIIKTTHPNTTGKGNEDASSLFPHAIKYANRSLDLVPGLPKAGSIVLKGVKHVGKFLGSKARMGDIARGVYILAIDEINRVDNPAFLTMLSNMVSQAQFCALSSQNFMEPDDLGGRATEPVGTYGGPVSFDELDIDRHQWWHSARSSITLRFDGHLSPNILSGRTIYDRLFNQENLDLMLRDYGEASPEYFSQVRSFPASSNTTLSVLSQAKVSASRHTDPFFTITRSEGVVSFLDPAFGGRDKAVWGYAPFGEALVTDAEGNQIMQELLVFKDFFKILKLVKDATYNDYWIDRMKVAGITLQDITIGSEVSYEDQIAIQCRENNRAAGVPSDCFGYDFSMRPDIVSSVNRMIGFSANAFDYNQGPEGIDLRNINKNSIDCCANRNTELAFLAADFFLTKQVRGGTYIATSIVQLSRTIYKTVNKKYLAEGKKEYKARWQQVSPDHRDVLMGICAMAVRKGFRQTAVSATVGGSNLWEELNRQGIGRARTGKRL